MAILPAAALLGVVLACCTYEAKLVRGSSLQPPPGTGELHIDMTGAWQVTSITPVSDEVPARDEAFTRQRTGLLPPRLGDELTIDAQGFATASQVPMRLEARPDRDFLDVQLYENSADGRVALFQIQATPKATLAEEGLFAWSIAAGSVGPDTMLASLRYFVTTGGGIVEGVQELELLRRP